MVDTTAKPTPVAAVHTARVSCEQRLLAEDTFELTLDCPAVAAAIRPGQFVMFRDEQDSDPLLGRPFALYRTNGDHVSIAYHVIGKQTRRMTEWTAGQSVRIWGPLGNGFSEQSRGDRLLFVGGGIGYSPFPATAWAAVGHTSYGGRERERRFKSAELIYGSRTAALLADTSDFDADPGIIVSFCTDDGSRGHHGRVTDLLERRLASDGRPDRVLTCGPVPMMRAVADRCLAAGVACELSLETPMACGFGACYSCVVPVKDDAAPGGWDYRRSCVDGPVFNADELVLAEM